jgi:hypothetical protein
MAFPTTTYTDNATAAAGLTNAAQNAGLSLAGLQPIAQLQSAVANLLVSDPSTVAVPAGDVTSGTFGANASPADTGTYTFPSAVVIGGALSGVTTLAMAGALSGATSVAYSLRVLSTTALATPAAYVATTSSMFASTVSGATLMGYGTTGDVTLKNRAGTDVLVITSNTTGVTLAGALAMVGAFTGATSMTFTTSIISTTALATPGALAATQFTAFASTVSGAALMGFGTTNDVALMNRAGTVVLGVGPNTTAVNMAGALVIAGALSGVTTLAVSGTVTMSAAASTITPGATSFNITNTAGSANNLTILDAGGITLGNPAAGSTQQVIVAGTGYGAGVASVRLNGLTTAAVTNQVGTLTNAPVSGNATFWIPVSVAGVIKYIPAW